ncbi:MAG: PucR family transcriptional regulator [Anaerovoracaceae bacterium]|nr:PucR family transcriptional regulator [Anaerovoracaceae bacterium]
MAFTVKDLFEIPITKNFRLIAGADGLDRPVRGIEILDFEFTRGVKTERHDLFNKNTLILTSLVFAKDDPSAILDAVKTLFSINVSCLAYKPVIFSDLPREVIEYADSAGFPILEFGGDEFFEDIIFGVTQALTEGDDISILEKDLERVLRQELSSREITKLAKKINPDFRKYIQAMYFRDEKRSDDDIIKLIRHSQSLARVKNKMALCKYKNGFFVFLSQDTKDEERFNALAADIFIMLGIDKSGIFGGISEAARLAEDFGKAACEAFWASNVAFIEKRDFRRYRETGVYRLIVPEIHSKYVKGYMNEYLAPLADGKKDRRELLDTACAYILSRSDLDDTAAALFCHKNTVRYRLSKLHELLDPMANEKEFQENLAIAVRIYLMSKFLY